MLALAGIFGIIGAIFGLVYFIFDIIILIQAFKSDTTQGILCLCVPVYIIYWAFAKMQHEKRKLFLTGFMGGFAGFLIFYGLSMVFGAMAITSGMNDLQNMYGTAYPGMPMTGMPMTGWPMTAQ